MELLTELRLNKLMGTKPNYSALSRKYGKDRHTIKKMMETMDEPRKERKKRVSCLDDLREEIVSMLANPAVSAKAAYWYFVNEKGLDCTYSNFKTYVRVNGLRKAAESEIPHPLYETPPGAVVQADWVEGIRLTMADGTVEEFSLFSATLSYSRLHYFEFADRRTESSFKRCVCHMLEWLGGTPKELLTDNMPAVVSVTAKGRKIHPSVRQFFSDLGMKVRLCDPYTPQTKGKDEASNKYAKWLAAYDGKLASRKDIPALVARLTKDINRAANSSTGLPPALLFPKEAGKLGPLPSREILRMYGSWAESAKVPPTQFVLHRGCRYSVPHGLIGRTVDLEEDDGRLYVFSDGVLVADHALSENGAPVADPGHLREGLKARIGGDSAKIDEYVGQTMSMFRDIAEARQDG